MLVSGPTRTIGGPKQPFWAPHDHDFDISILHNDYPKFDVVIYPKAHGILNTK